MLATFLDQIDVASIRVHSPSSVTFLCGGPMAPPGEPVQSMRDAYFKVGPSPQLANTQIVLAEDVTERFAQEMRYGDLLAFETDLAQICDLVLLFCESFGSVAELGAFASVSQIAEKLLVVVRAVHNEERSFIVLGPLKALLNRSPASVFVVDDEDISFVRDAPERIQGAVLRERLVGTVQQRLAEAADRTSFDPGSAGHLIKLVVGLVQEVGALTHGEIIGALDRLGIECDRPTLDGFLLCAKSVGWVIETRKGLTDYVFARPGNNAISFKMGEGVTPRDRVRRRAAFLKHWEKTDSLRLVGIKQQVGDAA